MMLTQQLIRKLKGKKYYTLPKGHLSPKEHALKFLGLIKVLHGKRHETLEEAKDLLTKNNIGLTLDDFESIIVMVRNPYDFTVSKYHYLKYIQKHNLLGKNMALANSTNFATFALDMVNDYNINDFLFFHDQQQPSNLKIVKYEQMHTELNKLIGPHLKSPISFSQKINSSNHLNFKEYIENEIIEEAIYKRFKILFDLGFYTRLKF